MSSSTGSPPPEPVLVCLPLETALELPLEAEARRLLWIAFLQHTGAGDGRRPRLLSALATACREGCERSLAAQAWLLALERCRETGRVVVELVRLVPEQAPAFWEAYGELVQALAATVHPLICSPGEGAAPAEERAEWAWQLYALLADLHERPFEPAHWMGVLELQLAQDGGLLWQALVGQTAAAGMRCLVLLTRLLELLDPRPSWVLKAILETLALELDRLEALPEVATAEIEILEGLVARLATRLSEKRAVVLDPLRQRLQAQAQRLRVTAPVAESTLPLSAVEVMAPDLGEWVGTALQLELAYLPGATTLVRQGQKLAVNLEHLIEADPGGLEDAFASLLGPLHDLAGETPLQLLEPESSLYHSLQQLWRSGEQVPLSHFPALAEAPALWHRLVGPSLVQAERLGSSLPALRLGDQALVVQLDPVELAALQVGLLQPEAVEPALARLRRDHHNTDFWNPQEPEEEANPIEPLSSLRRLHAQGGFYASSHAPLESFQVWTQRTLGGLMAGALWCDSAHTLGLFLPVAQSLAVQGGRPPQLHRPPDPLEIYSLMGGREVLYVGPHTEQVAEQHRSGRCFELFNDLAVEAFGLRVLTPPRSRHPHRPGLGFEQSLEGLLLEVEQLYRQRPFELLLADCGAYRLPLLWATRQRFGVRGLSSGLPMARLFGVEAAGATPWRETRRQADRWCEAT
ncbi:MAG: hypothetical protein N3Z29_01630 [Synechococcaceae cyanobacterium MAG-AL1]|nr:hypothetical protein [Candidatus Regnicoccus frigidus MAG-AL1]